MAQPQTGAWGERVIAIRIETDPPVERVNFTSEIVQKVNEPLERAKVNASLKRLYATGRFIRLRAEARREAGGVVLVFAGSARYFIGTVSVTGASPELTASSLADATRLRLGAPLLSDSISEAEKRLQSALAQEGFHHAMVGYSLTRNPRDQEANITFQVMLGPAARLSKIEFRGAPVFPSELLKRKGGLRPGLRPTSSRLAGAVAKIRQFYLRSNYPEAIIRIAQHDYNPKTNTENLVLFADAGPLVQVRVEGARVSDARLRTILPIFTEGLANQSALEAGTRDLEDYFERRGYLNASVRIARVARPDSKHLDVLYQVNLGPSGILQGYAFKGNRHIPSDQLGPLLSIRPQGWVMERSAFSHRLLERDVAALEGAYRARGFLAARVTPQIQRNYNGQAGDIFIYFVISEGPQTTIESLRINGLSTGMQKAVLPSLINRTGHPYSPENVPRDRATVLSFLGNQGYVNANMTWKVSHPAPDRVALAYDVTPGRRETIGRIVIVGVRNTRKSLIMRQLALKPGDPVNESQVFDSQQRLYDLGIFNQVKIAEQAPEGEQTAKTLIVEVEETRRWTLSYGGGIDVQRLGSNQPQGQYKASPRVSFDVTRLNVGGRAQTMDLRAQFSTLEKSAEWSYLLPRFERRRGVSLRFSALAEESSNVLTFTAKREEVGVTLEKRYSPHAFISTSFNYRDIQALDISNRISPAEIPILSQPARIGMFSLSYANDHRNNPIDATRGSYTVADAGISWRGFGSQANFFRFSGENATYYPITHWLTFARDTRLGVESPYGGTTSIQIPLPERFFMGGSESHRGFSINQAGPRDPETGFPIGGDALFLNSFELRTSFAQGRLGLVLFHDMGNVYSSIRRMRLFKVSQSPVTQKPEDFDYTVHAVGAGLLYNTPVGPLRFEVGYDLNPPRFLVVSNTSSQVERLPHWNFFISVGQSF